MTRRDWLLVSAVAAAGCSRGPGPALWLEGYDSEAARRVLVTALEAWKDGKAATLTWRNPPIRFADDDWLAGFQLMGYQFRQPDAPIRPFEAVPVALRLRSRQGKVIERAAEYQVTLTPKLAVLRSDS